MDGFSSVSGRPWVLTRRCILAESIALTHVAFPRTTQEFQMGRLVGKIVLITGGSSGIGLASARRFVSEGAFVFITGRRQQELDKALAEIGHDVRALQGDVSKV